MAEVQKRIEIRWNIDQAPWIAAWEDDDGDGIPVSLCHSPEGILRPWPMLHGEDADAFAGRHAAEAIRHVQTGALLTDDDGPDIGDRRRLDDRINGIPDENLSAFTFENFCDSCRTLHHTLLPLRIGWANKLLRRYNGCALHVKGNTFPKASNTSDSPADPPRPACR